MGSFRFGRVLRSGLCRHSRPTGPASGHGYPRTRGHVVVAPFSGLVIVNRTTGDDPSGFYLVVRDSGTGFEHVFGHIRSSLTRGQDVVAGNTELGLVAGAGTGSHLHWGVNMFSVTAAIDTANGWGVDRAPLISTIEQAAENGWIDPLAHFAAQGGVADPAPATTPVTGELHQLETGVYFTEAGHCDGSLVLQDNGIDQLRLIIGDTISFGYHPTCAPDSTTRVPGGTRFHGTCQESADEFDAKWVLQRHSAQAFTEIRSAYEGTGGLSFVKCANDSAMRQEWDAWFPGVEPDTAVETPETTSAGLPDIPEGFEIGVSAIVDPGIGEMDCTSAKYDHGAEAWYQCLRDNGASEDSLRFARLASQDNALGVEALLQGLREHGTVDVAEVLIPFLANTNYQVAFVTGDRIIPPGQFIEQDNPRDAGSRRVLRRYPQAFASGRIGIGAHRDLPGGIQRFVINDVLTNGCRACEVAGLHVGFYDFRDAELIATQRQGWTFENSTDSPDAMAHLITGGSVLELQRALNFAGYDAGPMDGAHGRAGARPRRRWASFRQSTALPPGPPSACSRQRRC